jgi:hypothetical protein
LNLDPSLQLGLTMLNIDPSLVAVDPLALSGSCDTTGLLVEVQPDRAGPWTLEMDWEGQWHPLADTGSSSLGTLEFDGRRWVFRVSWSEIRQAWGGASPREPRLRLGVGEMPNREYLELRLDDTCLPDTLSLPEARLRWEAEPWPNPFNPRMQSRISLDQPGMVMASVYDLRGRQVANLHRGVLAAGTHTLVWDGRNDGKPAAGGVYFLKIEGPGTVLSRKVVLLK